MRGTLLIVLALLVLNIAEPAYSESDHDQAALFTEGLVNGRMWTRFDDLEGTAADFYKLGVLHGLFSGQVYSILELKNSGVSKETTVKLASYFAEKNLAYLSPLEYKKHLDQFYGDLWNIKIPVVIAFYCIKEREDSGDRVKYEAMVDHFRKQFRK